MLYERRYRRGERGLFSGATLLPVRLDPNVRYDAEARVLTVSDKLIEVFTQKDKQIAELNGELKLNDERLQELNSELNRKNRELQELTARLTNKKDCTDCEKEMIRQNQKLLKSLYVAELVAIFFAVVAFVAFIFAVIQ